MRTRQVVLLAVLGMAATGTAIAGAEDDLAVVKRAVARPESPATATERPDEVGRRLSAGDLRWFKVRITEKGSKRARVKINVPIGLVRALGDDFPIDIGRHGRRHRGWHDGHGKPIRLSDVLATLEAGESLVEIDDDEANIRIWVE